MTGARIIGGTITHALLKNCNFTLYAYTACLLRVSWVSDNRKGNSEVAELVDSPIDCMTCLVRSAR